MKHLACVALAFGSAFCFTAQASADRTPAVYRNNPELLTQSQLYSQRMAAEKPELAMLLEKLNLQYLYQLDRGKVYDLNLRTGAVTTVSADQARLQYPSIGIPGFGFGTPTAMIRSAGGYIQGEAATTVTCVFGGQLAEVQGFMASTVARDPRGGVRNGQLVIDNWLDSKSVVDFSVLMASGGAKNPINRTVMETTHTGSCGDDLRVAELVSTWPPLRIDMAVDDTGSMGNELAGAKAGLASFIDSQQNSPTFKRDVPYELISFKDSPTLRLANTTDTGAALSAIQSLYAGGGDDCPEDSLGALNMALSRMSGDEDAEGAIVLVTDASPHEGSVDGVIAAAQAAGVKVHVLLSGDCTAATLASSQNDGNPPSTLASLVSARTVFQRIARETGGSYYYLPGGSAQDYAAILAKIFGSALAGDTEPPAVDVAVTPTTLWPANHKMVAIKPDVRATDNQDPNPVVTLESVTSSEPENDAADGNTEKDIEIATDGTIYLRAERSGSGEGRTYTITYRAVDASGNVGRGTATVFVPHDAN